MAEYTTHYNLKKPAKNENYNIDVANENNDIIDEKLYGKVDKKVGKDLSTNDFTDEYRKKLSELSNYDDSKIKKEISAIKEENKKQEQSIEEEKKKMQEYNDNAELLKEKVELLEGNLEEVKLSGKNVEIDDALKYYTDNHKIYGKSVQETRELSQDSASGEKVTLENVDPSRSIDIYADGNNRQETTTGKQLFNKDGDLSYPNNTAYTNATVLLSDGTLKSNSNANSNTSKGARLTGLKANTIYTVKGKIKSMTHNVRIRIMGYSTNWKAIVEPIFTSIGDFKFTFNTSSEYSDFFLSLNGYYNDSTTITEAIFDEVMVYEGTDDISYEKYTGGIPAPNPNYKQDIEVIDGCNLIDFKTMLNHWHATYTYDESTNTYNITNIGVGYSKPYQLFTKNTKISFGAIIKNITSTGASIKVLDSNDTPYGITESLEKLENLDIVKIRLDYSTNGSFSVKDFRINLGDTLKPYFPHGSIGLKFSGSNIWNENWENGAIDSSTGNIQELAQRIRSKDFIYVIPEKKIYYKMAEKYSTLRIACYNRDKSYLGKKIGWISPDGDNFVLPENCYYIKFIVVTTSDKYDNGIMLSYDNLQYEPYHEPQLIPINLAGNSIAKVSDTAKDKLQVSRNGKVILGKKTNRYIFTGNENWQSQTGNHIKVQNLYISIDNMKGTTSGGSCCCNIAKFSMFAGEQNDTNINICKPNAMGFNLLLDVSQELFPTINSFKQYLLQQYENGTPVYADYELATPQTIELPSINIPKLWEGTVNVELISNLSTNMNANYNIVPAMPSLEAKAEINSIDDVNIRICNENLAYEGWAEDFVKRINNSYIARLEEKDNRNTVYWLANVGYKDYDNKYIFKTNWKENTRYIIKFSIYPSTKFSNLCIEYTDGTTHDFSTSLKEKTWQDIFFITKEGKTVKYMRANYSDGGCWIDLDTFMVYEGTKTPQFIPNQTNKLQMILNKPLRGIKTNDLSKANYIDENGNYWITDYVADDGIHRKIGEIILNGSKEQGEWTVNSAWDKDNTRKYCNFALKAKKDCNLLSDRFIYDKEAYAKDVSGTMMYSSYLICTVSKNIANTVEEWKQWLSENTMKLQYELAEETLEEFTEEERKSWNEFKKLKTFKGKNYISSVDDIQAGLEFSYKKDNRISTKKELEKCNERLANIEQLLSTTETSSLLLDNLEKDLEEEV